MSGHKCFNTAAYPTEKLLSMLRKNPFLGANTEDKSLVSANITRFRRENPDKPIIYVGTGTCGLGAGAAKTLEAIRTYLAQKKADAEVIEVGCIGICSEEPLVDIQMPGSPRVCYKEVMEADVPGLLDSAFSGKIDTSRALGHFSEGTILDNVPYIGDHPFFATQIRWVLANCGIMDPTNIEEYIARGGYSCLAKVLTEFSPDAVCDTVEKSGLRGRGGGGFLAGKKWKLARTGSSGDRYLICNADEGDPGAFMDRAVIESDTFRLLEGMAIAAYALDAHKAYVYIRAEYPLAIKRLVIAIKKAKDLGLLGEKILGTDFNLEIVIKKGAGAFVCGEETALMHSIEGKRGMPRPRPPYPSESGLFGKPTIINNVETLANVPDVIRLGAEEFASIGTAGSKGTKVFALSGMTRRTGLVEVAMGTTIKHIIYEIAGGIIGGTHCKAVQMGGPAGGCIPEQHLDVKIDYESLKEYGAIMGSGGMVVMNEKTCMVDLAKYFMEFIQNESCGKCIPCREGTKRMLEILQAITRGRREETANDALLRMHGVVYLEQLANTIKEISLCGLGQNAPNPVLSTLRWFRDEYEAHIFERNCPAGVCKSLSGVPCERNCPVGTEVWRYVANIASDEIDEAYRIIRKANPFPSACARICNHPCENNCRNGTTGGDPIAVRTLKRYVVDNVKPGLHSHVPMPANANAKKIAVVGAGPSGLSTAHYLSLEGFKVTVFEKESIPGGMLASAIPEFRMPKAILAEEIASLLNQNIEIKYDTVLGKDFSVTELLEHGFHAVYIACGSHKNLKLGIPGEETEGVLSGLEFLKAYNLGKLETAHGKVGIIGGGNSAIDAARVAIRQKDVSEVTIFYRRTNNEMPAYEEEIHAAIEEGISIIPLMTPVSVQAENGKLASVTFVKNELAGKDPDGRPKPVPIPGSETTIALDTLIVAISERPDTECIDGIKTEKWGGIIADRDTLSTNIKGVFSGGDVVGGPGTAIEAIAAGKKAAKIINRYLAGKGLVVFEDARIPEAYIRPLPAGEDEPTVITRIETPVIEPGKRKKNFLEVELAVSACAAMGEAKRCLRCDLEFTKNLEER